MSYAAPPTRRRGRAAARRLDFAERLVLLQWVLGLFEVAGFDELAELLKDTRLEGFDEDNVSRFHRELVQRLFDRKELPASVLLGYDQNIVRHWRAITERRNHAGRTLYPKYFQYLALLFTEIYLDRYFGDADALLASLNRQVARFNEETPRADRVPPFEAADLRKLAFWMATGSGKTLLMHVQIQQYRHYLKQAGRERELNRIILLTPNEGLSRQHLDEFRESGIAAELFTKDGAGAFAGKTVEIIDIHKLRDDMGEKTVAVAAFESNNLVLVDEGHRGAGGVEWLEKRRELSEQGFSIEYSATFGQAMKAANRAQLTEEYARSILFDYSYKYFYRDGYGKDYQILNLERDDEEEVRQLYLTACLLAFYQQLRLFADKDRELRPFLLERPLWVFVGGSVNAVRTRAGREVSDVADILLFLAGFTGNRAESTRRLELLLQGRAGLHDARGREIFQNAFGYLQRQGATAGEVFDDLLRRVFNAAAPGKLHVELLRGADGEIALKLGENKPFGVINVGDAPKLARLCETFDELIVTDREFAGSLFHGLNEPDTTVNVLIGSKRFTEGWNSWRVSTMGLMNIGRSEGSEIIQLFGRGVRLRGHGFSLKRSPHLPGITRPEHIRIIETLNIFGIRADYMRQFKEYLEDEGLPPNEEIEEITLPVIQTIPGTSLRTIRLKPGLDFKRDGEKPTLELLDDAVRRHPVTLDWYPKIQAARSQGLRADADVVTKEEGKLTRKHLAFLDFEALYFELTRFKAERAWHNLDIPRESVRALLADPGWYRLLIPGHFLEFTGYGRVRTWQEIAATLLKKYCERYFTYRKQEWEAPYLEYRDLDPASDRNFFEDYEFLVDRSQEAIIAALEQLKVAIPARSFRDMEIGNDFHAIFFDRHLYQPLIYMKSEFVEVRPVALNVGERDFVVELRKFHKSNPSFFAGKELYLLRNQSRGRGIGFFEAGNFHPDFILWLLDGDKQYVTFVDPKGLRNLEGPDDPKIGFYKKIKELEERLGDPHVVLNSFIVSSTPHKAVGWWDGGMSEAEFLERHVLFKDREGGYGLRQLFRRL